MIVLGKDFKHKLYHVFPKGVSSYEDTPFKQPTYVDPFDRAVFKTNTGEGCWVCLMEEHENVPEWITFASDFRDYSGTSYYAEVIPNDDAKILIVDEDAVKLLNECNFQFHQLAEHVDMIFVDNYEVMAPFGFFEESFTDKMRAKYDHYPRFGFYGWDIISGVWLNEKFTMEESVAVNYTDKAPQYSVEIDRLMCESQLPAHALVFEEKKRKKKEKKKLKKKRRKEIKELQKNAEKILAMKRTFFNLE